MDSPSSSNSFTNQCQVPSHVSDAGSPNSAQTSGYEDTETDNYQANSRHHSYFEMQQYDGPVMDSHLLSPYAPTVNDQYEHQRVQTVRPQSDFYSVAQEDITSIYNGTGLGLTFSGPRTQFGLTSWNQVLEHCTSEFQSAPFEAAGASAQVCDDTKQDSLALEDFFRNDLSANQEDILSAQGKSVWQLSDTEVGSSVVSILDKENDLPIEGKVTYASLLKQLSLDVASTDGEGLKKYDSFSRWMSNELGEVDDSQINPSSEVYWSTIQSESIAEDSSISNQEQLDTYLVGPSLSQDQLFSILDFSPNWAYTGQQTKVIIRGKFLKNRKDVEKCKWSCMFGEIEVPAEVLEDGTLCCHSPRHKTGQVPFYITCSNRLACSEVREFEYRERNIQYMETSDAYSTRVSEVDLHVRLEKLLSFGSVEQPKPGSGGIIEKQYLISEINSLMMDGDDEWLNTLNQICEKNFSFGIEQDQQLGKLLKGKLHTWLIYKVNEDGKGPNVLDKEGQGVLHLAAALGYYWVIKPTVTAGVSVNFRDVRGWTALHWAAFYGREKTVAALISLGADPGLLTDPTPGFPSGRTPADLASDSGHKGIAGFLAESSLTRHLIALTLKDSNASNLAEVTGATGVGDVAEPAAVPIDYGDMQAGLSLKDSLSAVRNAAQAAARIHQVYRVQSFHRKKLTGYGDETCGISDERALSLIAFKSSKSGQHDLPVHAAAVRIQNKFRGWKGRKEFLVIRQRIVKIQAHIRGHQVRKQYKKFVWTVGIVEKAILRWRRKGSGLRGFRSDGLLEGDSVQNQPQKQDDYDFLQEGRKQSEARLEKALARVKSMVQYPEARDQYSRILNVVTGLQESKESSMNEPEVAIDDDFMIELEELCDDDTFMPPA
ncbi:calmodulin-binding transcription activator 3-like [Iris pallida]|uniref:Calmodulin-binding transcription activator 3-like n=1 Tax=Iris pallida TaxID=29817 RepID=A0AAX6DRU3_IRIPA|nr:calmodulin-binding transcription activator 3-like [Iris pallida]